MLHNVTSRLNVISASTRWSAAPAGMCRLPLMSAVPRSSVCGGALANTSPILVRSVVGVPVVV
jgi:hypothetical protein